MANTANRVAGTAYLTVDGTNYLARGEFSYACAAVKRESISGIDTVHGYSEMPFVPFIEGTITNTGGLDVAAFNDMSGVTVQLELANGKSVIGRTMWTTEPQEVSVDEGKFKVRWEGLQGSVVEA